MIGVHRGGIGQSSSFQDTYHTTLWEACAVEWTCGGGRREYPRLATGLLPPPLLRQSGGCVHRLPEGLPVPRRGFSQTKADFPSRQRVSGNSERTPNIPKTQKKNKKTQTQILKKCGTQKGEFNAYRRISLHSRGGRSRLHGKASICSVQTKPKKGE